MSRVKAEVKEKVLSKILKDYPFLSTQDVSIEVPDTEQFRTVPENGTSFRIDIEGHSSFLGRTLLPLQFLDEKGEPAGKRSALINVTARYRYFRTKAAIQTGTILSEQDLEGSYEEVQGKPPQSVVDLQTVVGKEVKATIPKDALLIARMVQAVPAVRQGDKVSIHCRSGNLELKIHGEAMEPGIIGEKIRVKSLLKERKILEGEIVDSKNVNVDLSY